MLPKVSFLYYIHIIVNVLKFRALVAGQDTKTNSVDPDQTASEEEV